MLSPKRVKWRKQHRTTVEGKAHRGTTLNKGEFGLVAAEGGWVTARQIEAARVAMTRYTKRGGEVWIRIFPDRPITKKAAETRMGSGKGNVEYWVSVIQRGRMIYEMAGIPEATAREALRLAAHKLPIKTKFVSRKLLEFQAAQEAKKAKVKSSASAGA